MTFSWFHSDNSIMFIIWDLMNIRKFTQGSCKKWIESDCLAVEEEINSNSNRFASYLMILSARYSKDCGIVRPICLAVFKLITNSNFVGCCTGRSAGLAPFRILST